MTARRLLALPLLSPLVAVLLLGALNPTPQLSFRVLTWSTPRAPLGLWLGGAAVGGAALSGLGAALALGAGSRPRLQRRVTNRSSRPWAKASTPGEGGWEGSQERQPSWEPIREPSWREQPVGGGAPPPRSPGEPPPTLDVPFRILHRPASSATAWAPGAPAEPRVRRERDSVPVGVDDDWGREGAAEEW
jgi:hypothetical protein